jgi:hypothetical protein
LKASGFSDFASACDHGVHLVGVDHCAIDDRFAASANLPTRHGREIGLSRGADFAAHASSQILTDGTRVHFKWLADIRLSFMIRMLKYAQ